MFTVRGHQDDGRYDRGQFMEEIGMIVKYKTELASSQKYQSLILISEDWETLAQQEPLLFRRLGDVGKGPNQLCQVLTRWQTVLYVDDKDHTIKHGNILSSPKNLFLVQIDARAYFICLLSDGRIAAAKGPDTRSDENLEQGLDVIFHNEAGPLSGFTLSLGGRFLAATKDGRIRMSGGVGTFERFSLDRADSIFGGDVA
jgi:hypothetical protein